MCEDMARTLKLPPDTVLREEIGRVLTQAIKETNAAEADNIKRHQAQAKYTLQPATLYTRTMKHGRSHPRQRAHPRNGKVVYNLSYHYPNRLWNAIKKARADDLKKRLKARGLAKQSWYLLGNLIGVNVDAPEYVKKAVARTGRQYPQNERVRVLKSQGHVAYHIENSQPTVVAINGEAALQKAIDNRVNYFLVNVSKSVFDDMTKVAKRYPGIIIP
jgi:hypothetical protein